MQVWSKSIHWFKRYRVGKKLRGRGCRRDPHQKQYVPHLRLGGHTIFFHRIFSFFTTKKISVYYMGKFSPSDRQIELHQTNLHSILLKRYKTSLSDVYIRKTCPCNEYPPKPHFYIVKLGYAWGISIFFIFAPKHRLRVLVRTPSARRF